MGDCLAQKEKSRRKKKEERRKTKEERRKKKEERRKKKEGMRQGLCAKCKRTKYLKNDPFLEKQLCAGYALGTKILSGTDGRLAVQPDWQDCQRSNEIEESRKEREQERETEQQNSRLTFQSFQRKKAG